MMADSVQFVMRGFVQEPVFPIILQALATERGTTQNCYSLCTSSSFNTELIQLESCCTGTGGAMWCVCNGKQGFILACFAFEDLQRLSLVKESCCLHRELKGWKWLKRFESQQVLHYKACAIVDARYASQHAQRGGRLNSGQRSALLHVYTVTFEFPAHLAFMSLDDGSKLSHTEICLKG